MELEINRNTAIDEAPFRNWRRQSQVTTQAGIIAEYTGFPAIELRSQYFSKTGVKVAQIPVGTYP
jgi:hypothetical protein